MLPWLLAIREPTQDDELNRYTYGERGVLLDSGGLESVACRRCTADSQVHAAPL